MTTLRLAKALIAITRSLPADAVPLAHVVLAQDDSLPDEIRHGLSATLLKTQKLEPMTRLGEVVGTLLVLMHPAMKGKDGVHAMMKACWAEIDAMEKRNAVAAAFVWFSAVCAVALHDPEFGAVPVLH